MFRRRQVLAAGAGAATLLALGADRASAGRVRITLDPGTRFQRIRAWEATAELFWYDDEDPTVGDPTRSETARKLAALRPEIYRRLIEEVGITRVRLETYAGAENVTHAFRKILAGQITPADWRAARYATVNDDDDPFHINPAGFDFADIDWRVENQLLPLQAAADRAGERLEVNLCCVAFTDQIRKGEYIHTRPEEYGEYVLAAFQHLKARYGIVPAYLEAMLEPDLVKDWTPEKLGQAIAAAHRRLTAAGFSPRIIAPSCTRIIHTLDWLDGIAAVPGAMDGMGEISFHRYWGGWPEILQEIAARAAEKGIETSMLEFWFGRATYQTLHEDLRFGNISAWQGRTMLTCHSVDLDAPEGRQVRLNDDVRYTLQYTRHVRPGAVRIGARSDLPGVIDPLAFVDEGGGHVVVIKAEAQATVEVTGLPAGSYRLSHAVAEGSALVPGVMTVAEGRPLRAEVPGAGVMTIAAVTA